ncbi:uncharacterized protein XM38_024790 [Halomicronema hongdechloris C2206]|uniref:DUF2854 domain-containing protein n=2 Tax=Halomicronema hongdechloris TaxID=1209493 RepID=A0A1Z3HN04_9CYAN|nr:DUF2854 domain-containing protein [Halomicronema hongdechloris]ASC71527.1 uncharacterized protein XM38_024790 [Halomicronema hongdechloris C2206]
MVGSVLTVIGFIAYFQERATLNLVGFFCGIPILLGGLALKAAELEPVPYSRPTALAVLERRQHQATPIQKQLRQDITRYRYGQQAHLDEVLERLGLSPTDEERPVLAGLHEDDIDGNYGLVLEFRSPHVPLSLWQEKQARIETFFGPGVRAQIQQPETDRIELALVSQPHSPSSQQEG